MRRTLLLVMLLGTPAFAEDGLTLIRSGQLAEAMPVVRAEALAAPADAAAQERWIDLMLTLGVPEMAQRHYEERRRTQPLDPLTHYLVGRAALDEAASLTAYEAALRLDPDHPRAWMGLGALHRGGGRLNEAGEAYRRALLGDPLLEEAWGGLIAVFIAAGDMAGAAQVAREAVGKVPTLAEGWLALAAARPSEAGALLREGVRRCPWDPRLQLALAEQLLREGDARGALAAADRALAASPSDTDARLARLLARERLAGTLDAEGMITITRARRLAPSDPGSARMELDAAIQRSPRSALALIARGTLRSATDMPGAIADLERALVLAPDEDEIHATLGKLLARSDPKRAAPLLDHAATRRTFDASLALAAAQAHAASGDVSGALSRLTVAEGRFPLHVGLAVARVGVLSQAGRKAEAYEAAKAASLRIPDPRVLVAAGAAAVEADRLRDAADHYAAAARATGRPELAAVAERLRAKAAAAP